MIIRQQNQAEAPRRQKRRAIDIVLWVLVVAIPTVIVIELFAVASWLTQ